MSGSKVQWTLIRAKEAGSWGVLVDPFTTLQESSGCGQIKKKYMSRYTHARSAVPDIGCNGNAALNIPGLELHFVASTGTQGHAEMPANVLCGRSHLPKWTVFR